MSTHRCIVMLTAFLFCHGLSVQAVLPDDPAYVIRLAGIPGPYCFERVCKLRSGDMWDVGGGGSVQYLSRYGPIRRTRVLNADLNGVFFVSANAGWIVGELGTIAYTGNAGNSWNVQASGIKDSLQAITCTDESRCWAVGDKGAILNTSDRGNHWTIMRSGVSKILFAVSFVNYRSGWAVGEDGLVLHTTDGGKSWEKQQAHIILFPAGPFAKPTDLLTVKFVDASNGWVGGAGGIATTLDGGKTWKAKEIEGAAFIGLVSHDGNTVWAINREGSNYLTRDRGLTWEPVNSDGVSAKRFCRS